MARPVKNNADYFPHDAGMRNDRKIKALRAKFGLIGYAFWNMLLETLTESNNLEIGLNDIEIELLASDFGVTIDDFNTMIEYLNKINLIVINNDVLYCPKLIERLTPLFEKRKRDNMYRDKKKDIIDDENPKKKNYRDSNQPKNEFSTSKTILKDIIDVENPTVKESKVKESKVNNIISESAKVVLEYLNEKANKKFRLTPSNLSHIKARLKDGYTFDECKRVIDNQIKDDYFKQNPKFLNPETLFRPSNIDKYLNNTAVSDKRLEPDCMVYAPDTPEHIQRYHYAGKPEDVYA